MPSADTARVTNDTAEHCRRILNAALRLRLSDLVSESPLQPLHRLSERTGNRVLIKREDLQVVNSFKLRGAYAKLLGLDDRQRQSGVICASAGNHAQGVAMAAAHLKVQSTVVMPEITPEIKIAAVRKLGAEVLIHGADFDSCCDYALRLAERSGRCFVHPYDDWDVIAGQATVALEMLSQSDRPLDYLFVPVGGGGLAAGIGAVAKTVWPDCRIVGVEARESASLTAAIARGRPVSLKTVGSFADGVAVRRVGDLTFPICQDVLHATVVVDTDEICAAVQDIYEDTRAIAEPAGALAVAGLKRFCADNALHGFEAAAVLTGANVNFARLRHIAERAALGEDQEALLGVTIPERPGSFLQFCETIGARSITEFNYRYHHAHQARVFVGIDLKQGQREKAQVIERLTRAGYPVQDLSGNEVAKLHIRYMVGGANAVNDERLFRFEFPERAAALLRFLGVMRSQWNISLFHYRNHGSDFGRVLMGVQVPERERMAFLRFLNRTGYAYREERDNPAYALFLAHGKADSAETI